MKLLAPLSLLCLVACAGTRHEGLVEQTEGAPVTLRYKPSRQGLPAVSPCGGIAGVAVTDPRLNPKQIGVSFHEDRANRKLPITASAVDKWVHAGVDRSLTTAGVLARNEARPELHVAVEKVELEQKIAFNAEYDGTVRLEVSLVKPGAAQPCWRGLTEGFAENYGRPDNAENFSETLNHALDRAVSKLLTTEDFEAALCGVCG